MHLVLARPTIRRKRHESVMRRVMGSGSSSDPERSKNADPEEAQRPARIATEQRVDSITSVGITRNMTEDVMNVHLYSMGESEATPFQNIEQHRSQGTPFDIVIEGETPGDDPVAATVMLQPLAQAGVTWWLEAVWASPESKGGVERMFKHIR